MFNDKHRDYGITPALTVERLETCLADERLEAVEFAVLFGSRARSRGVHPQSDYDIAVYSGTPPSWGIGALVWDVMTRHCGLNDCELDVVDLAQATLPLLQSIAEGYIVLKGDPDGFSNLLAKLQKDRGE